VINNSGSLIKSDLFQMQNDAMAISMPSLVEPTSDDAATSFADSLKLALQGVNEKDQVASELMANVDSGRSDDLVGAMLASQDASLSFSMMMQVRNKVVGALDELIKLQL